MGYVQARILSIHEKTMGMDPAPSRHRAAPRRGDRGRSTGSGDPDAHPGHLNRDEKAATPRHATEVCPSFCSDSGAPWPHSGYTSMSLASLARTVNGLRVND
jgi:hypothetical protein